MLLDDIVNESVSLYNSIFGPKEIKVCIRYAIDKYIQPDKFTKLSSEYDITKDDYIDWVVPFVEKKLKEKV